MRWSKGGSGEGRGGEKEVDNCDNEKKENDGGGRRWMRCERGKRESNKEEIDKKQEVEEEEEEGEGGGGGGRSRSVFPGLSRGFLLCFSQLVCQQEALGSSWIRPSVRDLAADPENETPPTHTHTHTLALCCGSFVVRNQIRSAAASCDLLNI